MRRRSLLLASAASAGLLLGCSAEPTPRSSPVSPAASLSPSPDASPTSASAPTPAAVASSPVVDASPLAQPRNAAASPSATRPVAASKESAPTVLAAPAPPPKTPTPAKASAIPTPTGAAAWQPSDCDGAVVAESHVEYRDGTATLVGQATNTTGFAVKVSNDGPVARPRPDGPGGRLFAYFGYPREEGRGDSLEPGEVWTYRSAPLQTSVNRWQDTGWNPIILFEDDEVVNYCGGQRSVPGVHFVQ